MILRRYSDPRYIFDMTVSDFKGFWKIAQEAQKEERLFNQWVVQLPYMNKDDFISFDDYRDKLTGRSIDMRSTADLEAELDDIERKFEV